MTRAAAPVGTAESWGAFLLGLAAVQFILVMVIAQVAYSGYSLVTNFVSDLGAAQSPLAWLFNGSLWVLGILGVAGTWLVRTAFPRSRSARAGLIVFGGTWVFAFLVGVFPEDAGSIHTNVSAIAFICAGISLLLLGLAMLRDKAWARLAVPTAALGGLTLAAFVVFALQQGGGAMPGVWERLVIFPALVWSILASIRVFARQYRLAQVRPAANIPMTSPLHRDGPV